MQNVFSNIINVIVFIYRLAIYRRPIFIFNLNTSKIVRWALLLLMSTGTNISWHLTLLTFFHQCGGSNGIYIDHLGSPFCSDIAVFGMFILGSMNPWYTITSGILNLNPTILIGTLLFYISLTLDWRKFYSNKVDCEQQPHTWSWILWYNNLTMILYLEKSQPCY